MIYVKKNIAEMSPYAPPWSGLDRTEYLRLDLNENTLGPPKKVVEDLKDYIGEGRIQMYPDYRKFLPKLAQYVGVDEDRLILSNGSDQAIDIILRAFLGRGSKMVIAQPGFPIFDQVAGIIGAEIQGVPYKRDMKFPIAEFNQAIGPETALIVIINPNNPTGSTVSLGEIRAILKSNPDIPVVVDEAYYEYTATTALGFLADYPNLIVTRTFSKAFAMAGLRLGYIVAHPDIVSQFYKIRGPFDVNSCALIAAGSQIDYADEWKQYIDETMNDSKPYLEWFFNENDVEYYPGAAHFMLVKPDDRDEVVRYLKANGILVRPMTAPLIEDTFRMSVGTLEQTKRFAEVYACFLRNKR